MRRPALLLIGLLASSTAWSAETGPGGINSDVTGLDGTGVPIGHTFTSRIPKAGLDGDAFTTPNVVPDFVYEGASSSQAGSGVGLNDPFSIDHALAVGQILHGTDLNGPIYTGVASGAQLHTTSEQIGSQGQFFSLQALATRNSNSPIVGDRVRAINMSFGTLINPIVETLNGGSQFTQFIDWSTREHDVTYVVAWPNVNEALPSAPSDNFNAITVAASQPAMIGSNGVYDRFDVGNTTPNNSSDAAGLFRTSIDLLAPGDSIRVIDRTETATTFGGTSAATPHVTGAVALLHEYAKGEIAAGNPAFDSRDSRQHEVMKAVLLNSADKLDGVHGSKRSILRPDGNDWVTGIGTAFDRPFQPLDQFLGAGHLNVERAIEQFRSGATQGGDVGWVYERSGGIGDRLSFGLANNLKGGDYIAATLVWDKETEKTGRDDRFNAGDQFFPITDVDDVLSNLDLYLVPADSNDPNDAVKASISFDDSVEHIFFEVPEGGGEYKLIVDHAAGANSSSRISATSLDARTDFALAWWAYEPTSILPGDYDGNGTVEQADYTVWAQNYGASVFPGRGADGNLDGVINAADFTVWRDAFSSPAISVPEPTSTAMVSLLLVFRLTRRMPSKCSTSRG